MSIDLERRDAVAVLTLNRPEALNALSPEMLDDLERVLREVDADPTLRAVVLTGAGEKAFCAGRRHRPHAHGHGRSRPGRSRSAATGSRT